MTIEDERPQQPAERDTLPVHTMQHYDQYQATNHVDRV
jgi:hypothetical protein